MFTRQAGTLSNVAPRTIGKFYQTQKLSLFANAHEDAFQQTRPQAQPQQMKTRTKSVGHIYNTRCSANKQHTAKGPSQPSNPTTKFDYDRLINYHEVENKLSNYLECTIRTNSRQKYNYLSSHFCPKYESLASTQKRIEPSYGRQQNLLRVAENRNDHEIGGLRQRKSSLGNQVINTQKVQQKAVIVDRFEKVNPPEKNERKQLKNSRKTASKQNLVSYQSSATKSCNKQNIFPISSISKKENTLGLASMNHEQHKTELQNKLKKLISNYEVKNKELQTQLHRIQAKVSKPQPQKKQLTTKPIESEVPKEQTLAYKNEELKEVLSKLIDFNLKGINLNKECDQKQQQIWRSIHQQILADEQLRIIKCFINEANINQIFTIINQNRIKKIEIALLKTHPDEYDPFLIEKFNEFLKCNNPNLTHKLTCKWISEQFAKCYELSQKNWLKHLSQEKIECTIRTMVMQKQVTSLRKSEGSNKELLIRDFTRYLSTLFKANLRNRNVYQIHHKLKTMSYIGRFIELLEEKAGKGVDLKKVLSK